jgi:acylphosphatase
MSQPKNIVRLHVRVTGLVQGVGFRAHVVGSARELGLTGWVRNVGYGSVEAVAEGERQQLERLGAAVRAGPRGSRVDETTVEWQAATGEFKHFLVSHSI